MQYYGLSGGTQPGVGPGGVTLGATQVATGLEPGDFCYLFGFVPAANAGGSSDALVIGEEFVGTQPTLNYASIPICITPGPAGEAPMICFEIAFLSSTAAPAAGAPGAAPGTFELDIQEADTDADAFYILPTNAAYKVTAVNATTNKARVDLSPTGGKFMRVLLVTLTNDVDFTVKATRLA